MFLPLLQMVDGESQVEPEQMGNLAFLLKGMEFLGLAINLNTVLLIILFFFTFKGCMKFLEGYFKVVFQQFFIKKIRIRNIRLFSDFSYIDFVTTDSGRIQNTFSSEVERVNLAYRSYFMTIQAAVLVSVYVTLAYLSNPQFALLITIGGVITNFVFLNFYKKTKSHSRNLTQSTHSFQGLLIQNVTHFKYLKATNLIYRYSKKLITSILEIEKHYRNIGVINSFLQALREPLTMLVVITVIIIQVELFEESLSLIVLSLLFFYRGLTFLLSLQNQWNIFLSVSGSLENMENFSSELEAKQEKYGDRRFEGFSNAIELKHLYFSFRNKPILRDISLTINKNETVAIVGESGSGKTTLINLLGGVYKPERGGILVDGTDLHDYDIRTFQKKIGYITQEAVVFNDTLYNNVTFWDKKNESNLKSFYKVLELTSLKNFAESLDDFENSLLGNNGINLSGGQRQRVSIARELYKDADILLMDEATSSLDSDTEKQIQFSIDRLKGDVTIIVIAHRLSTVKNADKIIVLKDGVLEDCGTFSQLMQRSESFNNMVSLQEF